MTIIIAVTNATFTKTLGQHYITRVTRIPDIGYCKLQRRSALSLEDSKFLHPFPALLKYAILRRPSHTIAANDLRVTCRENFREYPLSSKPVKLTIRKNQRVGRWGHSPIPLIGRSMMRRKDSIKVMVWQTLQWSDIMSDNGDVRKEPHKWHERDMTIYIYSMTLVRFVALTIAYYLFHQQYATGFSVSVTFLPMKSKLHIPQWLHIRTTTTWRSIDRSLTLRMLYTFLHYRKYQKCTWDFKHSQWRLNHICRLSRMVFRISKTANNNILPRFIVKTLKVRVQQPYWYRHVFNPDTYQLSLSRTVKQKIPMIRKKNRQRTLLHTLPYLTVSSVISKDLARRQITQISIVKIIKTFSSTLPYA